MLLKDFLSRPIYRLGVVGSRDWPDKARVWGEVEALLQRFPEIQTLVSGGQPKGVDGWVPQLATDFGLTYAEHLPAHYYLPSDPRYHPYDVKHYHQRNQDLVEDVEALMAFRWDMSAGTSGTVAYAKRRLMADRIFVFDLPT
jgi:hypothetical protein